jgi:hypothetical protein
MGGDWSSSELVRHPREMPIGYLLVRKEFILVGVKQATVIGRNPICAVASIYEVE